MLDFLIIGGGIAGLSAAARLAELGRVLVVEAEDTPGHHASGRSAALYASDYGAPATVAVTHASEAGLRAMNALSPRGYLMVAKPDERDLFDRECVDLAMREITREQALAMVPILNPDTLGFAAYTGTAQDIDTDLVMQTYTRAIRAAGGEIRTRAPVTGITRTEDGWRVMAGGVEVSARRIVNAAGAWADRIAVMAGLAPIGFTPLRRSIAQIPGPAGFDISRWPMFLSAGETWYAKPQAGKLLVSPADEEPAEPHDAWADDMVLAEGLARYEEMVTTPVTRVETSWAGLRTFAPDRTLVLGPDPLEPAFLWCAGQGGQGFQSAPGVAAVLLETAGGPPSGQPDAILRALSPARFR